MKSVVTAPSVLVATALFAAAPLSAAEGLLQAACNSGGKQAEIHMDAAGQGRLTMQAGEQGYSCELALHSVEGPPFGDNATGMLVIGLAKGGCEPAAAKRQVQRHVFVHLTAPETAGAEAMAVIERRAGVFQCQVAPLDLGRLKPLLTPAS